MHGGDETAPARLPAQVSEPEATETRLGRYRVRGQLGRGGMGVVHAGYDELLRRRVAIKQINRRAADERARRRSLREAQAMASLAHPNIVSVYEVFEVDAQLCIVMEYVGGRTLREWIAEVRPSQLEIRDALMQAGRGIAAAHAAGIVHRDLKPDNIMVGDDGRVRVMDFGLARAVDSRQDSVDLDQSISGRFESHSGAAPYTGAFIGTPGYTAPEQELGVNADARSDVFSFCVLAFEVLHGRRPFIGDGDSELFVAIVAGQITSVPGSAVPGWLDAVIRRGLAVEPDARWPTMVALLAALGDDPTMRRRRRLRVVGVLVATGVLVVLALAAAASLRAASERARVEAAAEARLRSAWAAIDRAEAGGDAAAAEAAFRTFVDDPEHRETRALTRAWLDRGDRASRPPGPAERQAAAGAAKAAYAEAYVHAQTTDDEVVALRRLSGVFAAQWDGEGLARAVGSLRARAADDDEIAARGLRAALWQRDLPGAAEELARPGHPDAAWLPTLGHLARATAAEQTVAGLEVLPGEGPTRLAVRDRDSKRVALLTARLTEVGHWQDDGLRELVPRTTWALAQTGGEARVVDVFTGAVLARGAPGVAPIAAYDATGDGVPELLFGRGWPQYGLWRWDGIGRPDAQVRAAHAATDAGDSTIESRLVADLDGDGSDELVLGFGPGRRFDVRVYRPDARGELELVTARRLGRVGALAQVQRGPRRLLAAFVDDSAPAPEVFPEPPHTGGPQGVHLFEWTGGELVPVDVVAFAPGDGFGRVVARAGAAAGDLDGDGREDLVFTLARGDQPWLLVLRQTEAGFESLAIAGLELFAGAQLDGDAAPELLVAQAPTSGLLALGLGESPTPRLPRAQGEATPPPEALAEDPRLALRWRRAEELAALALTDSAAGSLRDAAALTDDRAAKSALLDRAGELLLAGDRMLDVLALDPGVHDDPRVRGRARARRAEAMSRLGRHADALVEAKSLRGDVLRDGELFAAAEALIADLAPLLAADARVQLRFDAPLDPRWQIHTPGALRREPGRAALRLELPATDEPAAELPIEWGGGPVALEFELDVERLESGAGVEVALVDARGEPWLGAALVGQAGGGGIKQVLRTKTGGGPWTIHSEQAVPSAIHGRRIHLRMTYFPERGHVDLILGATSAPGGDVGLRRIPVAAPPGPGPHRLILGGVVEARQSGLALAELRRLVIQGARPGFASAADIARGEPARLLAEHDPRAVLAALAGQDPPHPRAAALRLLALAEQGELAALVEAAPTLLAHLEDPRWLGALTLLLRRQPLAAAALRGAAGPALLPALASVWAFARAHRGDPGIRDEILDGLRELESLAPQTAGEREALEALLATRAELRRLVERPLRASW